MQNFKPKRRDIQELTEAAVCLKAANDAMGRAKKDAEAAKKKLSAWLQEQGVTLEGVAVGEMLQIDGVVLIEVGQQRRFNEDGFLLAEPALHEKWMHEVPVRRFKPLV